MKVAVSIPDQVFEDGERVAKRLRIPRSRVYAQAIEEFAKKHRAPSVRQSLEAVYRKEATGLDTVLTDLQARALREKW